MLKVTERGYKKKGRKNGKKIITVLLVAAMLTMDIPSKLMPGTISVQAAETGTIEAKETETEEIQGKAGQAGEQESEKNETVQTENEQTEEEQAMEETSKHIKQVSEPIGLDGTHILVHKGGYKLSFILEGTESDAVQLTEDAGIIPERLLAKIETKEKIEIPETR